MVGKVFYDIYIGQFERRISGVVEAVL